MQKRIQFLLAVPNEPTAISRPRAFAQILSPTFAIRPFVMIYPIEFIEC